MSNVRWKLTLNRFYFQSLTLCIQTLSNDMQTHSFNAIFNVNFLCWVGTLGLQFLWTFQAPVGRLLWLKTYNEATNIIKINIIQMILTSIHESCMILCIRQTVLTVSVPYVNFVKFIAVLKRTLFSLLKWLRCPKEDTLWHFLSPIQWHTRSTSWQHLASKDGELSLSLCQFPLT